MEFYHNLSDLTPVITGWHIRVKVINSVLIHLDRPHKMLTLILSDENGNRIEAVVDKKFAHYYWSFMDEGQWFTIMNFGVGYNSDVFRATKHQYKIWFLQSTLVKKTRPVMEIPNHHFVPFSTIMDDSVDESLLVDVVGAIIKVGTPENTAYNKRDIEGYKITFDIKDKDERVIECVALKQEALDFDLNYRLYGGDALVVVLRWWKVYRYWPGPSNVRLCTNGPISKIYPNPNIQQVDEIREMLARTAGGNMANQIPAQENMANPNPRDGNMD